MRNFSLAASNQDEATGEREKVFPKKAEPKVENVFVRITSRCQVAYRLSLIHISEPTRPY